MRLVLTNPIGFAEHSIGNDKIARFIIDNNVTIETKNIVDGIVYLHYFGLGLQFLRESELQYFDEI